MTAAAKTAADVQVTISGTIVINGIDIPFIGTALIPQNTPITVDSNTDIDSDITVGS